MQYKTSATTNFNTPLVRIELGSGSYGIIDFIHIDAVKTGNVDYQADVRNLNFLETESVDELYSAHTVEHFSYTEITDILIEWNRVLKVGGKITIKMPDLDFLCRAYVENIHSTEETMIAIFGGFSDEPGGIDGWEKISGDSNWQRNSIKDGDIPCPGKYTEWGAHKALYTFETFKLRMKKAGFKNIQRVVETDWELYVTATK